jgi:hypothetical protein
VHDLGSRKGRDFLEEVEGRHKEERESLATKVAAVAGVLGFGVMFATGAGYILSIASGMAFGVVAWPTAQKALYRPRMPFLSKLPPADRP